VLQIANDSACSAFDSEFVCLARNAAAELITADRKILKALPDSALVTKNFLDSGSDTSKRSQQLCRETLL
jgi:predicted nucleic acid-binding protein